MSTISNNKSILDDLQSTQTELEDLLGDSRYSNSFDDIRDSLTDVGEYIDEVKGHITNQIRSVSIRDIKVPNSKDQDEWYAGGDLRNNYYSPTTHAPITNEPKALDLGGMLMLGDFEFLNPAWNTVQYLAQGGILDLMRDYSKREVEVYSYTVTIKNPTDGSIISERFGEVNISGERDSFGRLSNSTQSPTSNFTTQQISNMYENKFSFMAGPIKMGVDIVSLTTGEDMSIEQTIGAGLVGTAIETFTSIASQTIASKFGVQSMYGLGIVGTIIGAITNELAEMAMGIDKQFGFGGEITGYDVSTGYTTFDKPQGFLGGLADVLGFDGKFGYDGIGHVDQFGNSVDPSNVVDQAYASMHMEMSKMNELGMTNMEFDALMSSPIQGAMTYDQHISTLQNTLNSYGASFDFGTVSDLDRVGLDSAMAKSIAYDIAGVKGIAAINANSYYSDNSDGGNGYGGVSGTAGGMTTSQAHNAGFEGPSREGGMF